jgi:hypothetical protein
MKYLQNYQQFNETVCLSITKISKPLQDNNIQREKSKFLSTKILDENVNPKVVYHGTWSLKPFVKFKKGDVYFSDDYDVAKMFGINREGGVDVENMYLQKDPFVITIKFKNNKTDKKIITYTDMESIFPDLFYDYSPEGIWDINEKGFNILELCNFFNIENKNTIKNFTINKRKVSSGVDINGVSKHFINILNPLIIDAKGNIWGDKEGDIQVNINNARNGNIYDGVVVKNIVEGGPSDPYTKPTTTYVVFNI